ncbi:hypothetical protein FNV43_RR01166 [Rhamnella rubrinervis]|uniref:Uncharacterized protein n=1 Tax=Rhamnella rubrinervis TaxID=2594499 RepID=A0A8K0MSL0_9ROSA|nr:hypothetical protein FNV43_RR01166 [Rhamnella rubrinervis]
MGFASFLGRVLFASLFILSAWQAFNEFDVDGGPAVKELVPKLTILKKNLSSSLELHYQMLMCGFTSDMEIIYIQARQLAATIISAKGIGGILFVFGSSFGAYVLILLLALTTPVLYDFYNYSPDTPQFGVLSVDFLQNIALFGALLFFVGMKNSIPKRQVKKKAPKAKAG